VRCFEAEDFSGSMIEGVDGVFNGLFRDLRHVASLWNELPDEAVGVFVGAALPGAVWVGEVDGDSGPVLDGFEGGELLAVVEREGPAQLLWKRHQGARQGLGDGDGLACVRLGRDEVSALALDQGQDAPGSALAFDEIALPIAMAPPCLDDAAARADRDAARDQSSGEARHASGFPPFSAPSQVSVQVPAQHRIAMDPAIDGLDGEPHGPLSREVDHQPPGDLFRRPMETKPGLDIGAQPRVREPRSAPGRLSSLPRAPIGMGVEVGDTLALGAARAGVARELAGDDAVMASERAPDGAAPEALAPQGIDDQTFAFGEVSLIVSRRHGMGPEPWCVVTLGLPNPRRASPTHSMAHLM
jgi:hypothetical protein